MGESNSKQVGLDLKSEPAKNPSETETPNPSVGSEPKPKKKICCACPDTKRLRDECVVQHGESACAKWIEAHKQCLRAEGFKV